MLKEGLEERFASIIRGLRKYKPINCSKGRGYLEPYYDPLPPTESISPIKLSGRPRSQTPGVTVSQQREHRPLSVFRRKPQSMRISVSKGSIMGRSVEKSVESAKRNPSPLPITAELRDGSMSPGPRASIGKGEQHSHRTCSYCYSPETLRRLNAAKSPKSPNDVRNRLTEFIANCDRPQTDGGRLKHLSLKLSVSFSDLQECLKLTKDNTGRGEVIPRGDVAQTIRNLRRQKREENRNVSDKATLQLLVDQKREVSNYIITKFRRIRMWKHSGNIVPRKVEESMYQHWYRV